MAAKWALGINAAVFLAIGAVFWIAPHGLIERIGIDSTQGPAVTDIRAVYGGLDFGIGLIFAWCLTRPPLIRPALGTAAILFGCLIGARLTGMLLDDSRVPIIYGLLLAEAAGLAVSLFGLYFGVKKHGVAP